MNNNTRKPLFQGFLSFTQWEKMYHAATDTLKGQDDRDVHAIKKSYFEWLNENLNRELQIDLDIAFSILIKLSKRYKGFSEYLEINTPYKKMLSLIEKGEKDKAEKEYKRIFKASPDLQFIKAKNLADEKQNHRALELASKILVQFNYSNKIKAQIHLFIAEQKAILNRSDANVNIEAACDLYLQELDGLDAEKKLPYLFFELLSLRAKEIVWFSYQELIAEKLSAKFSGEEIIVLCTCLDSLESIFSDEITALAIKKRLDVYDKYITGKFPDSVRDAALLWKAEQLMLLSRYEDSVLVYKESMLLVPDQSIWSILAHNQNFAGLYNDALFSINKALEYNPDNEIYLQIKFQTLLSLGRQKEALEIAKSLPKSAEDKLSIFEWNTLLTMGETSQIVERYANLERDNLSGKDYIAWMSGLWYENKMNQANDIFVHLLDNMDTLPDKDDPILLFVMVNLGSSFAYKISDLYDKYINSLLSQGQIIQLTYKPKALDVDLVDWLKRKDKLKELVEKVRSEKVPFDFKLMALCNIDPVAARGFLEEYRDLLDVIQYRKHDLRLSLLEGKTIENDLDLNILISELKEKDFDLLLNTAYEKERYDLVSGFLDIRPSARPMYTWYKFLACTFLGENEKGRQVLESVDFDHLINTHKFSASDNLISIGDVKMSPIQVLESIDSLFPSGFPYHRIALENFITLLKKASDPSLHKPIDWAVEAVLETIKLQPSKLNMNTAYGDEYNDLMVKKTLMDRLSKLLTRQEQKNAYASQCLRNRIQESILERYTEIVDTVKREERNRILANLSHSIKNMLRSVIDPLVNLRNEVPEKGALIENAIKGANLIREIVNAINLSFKTSIDDLLWDSQKPGIDSMSLHDIVTSSIRYSIGNMFDFRYFPAYAGNYFPRNLNKVEFQRVKDRWDTISSIADISMITDFVNDNMFMLDMELSDVSKYRLGNDKSSAIKLMILFQEIIFNAVKYASFVARKDRFIEIRLIDHEQNLSLTVSNSYRPEVQAKTTGVGKLVIENFAKVLDCQPEITTTDQVYTIRMEFNNIWRNHAQDPLH